MRIAPLLACLLVVAACSPKEEPPVADTSVIVSPPAPAMSLASIAGTWNVVLRPEGQDTVVTSYLLDTRDSTAWTFTFPNGKPIAIRVTGMSGDTVISETGWFESSVQKGVQAQTNAKSWIQDGKLVGRNVVHYKTTGPDTVRVFTVEGTRQ